ERRDQQQLLGWMRRRDGGRGHGGRRRPARPPRGDGSPVLLAAGGGLDRRVDLRVPGDREPDLPRHRGSRSDTPEQHVPVLSQRVPRRAGRAESGLLPQAEEGSTEGYRTQHRDRYHGPGGGGLLRDLRASRRVAEYLLE